ncbi:FixH family protein [Sulfuriferula nivalis]|nr:FixH family protein [Sulfuriferula nivalis]
MTLLTGAKKEPSNRMHWIPKIFIGFFMVLFVVDGSFVSISSKGVSTQVASWFLPKANIKPVYTAFSGVTRHDEHAGAPEAEQLKKLNSLQTLGWKIEIDGVNNLIAGEKLTNAIVVNLHDKQNQPILNADVQVRFFRAGNVAAVAESRLDDGGLGQYNGQFTIPHSGTWIMRTEIEAEGKRLEVDRDVLAKKAG